jgi:hypothetical protein
MCDRMGERGAQKWIEGAPFVGSHTRPPQGGREEEAEESGDYSG